MTAQEIKALGTTAEGKTITGILQRIETKIDTIIENQGNGGTTSGDTPPSV